MLPARPRTAAEDGFTLVELLIAATLMMIVLTASLATIVKIDRGQREVASRTDELSRARQGVERMTREIRQASAVTSVTPSSLTVDTIVRLNGAATPVRRSVTYACASSVCTRSVAGATATVLVPNVTNTNVFASQATNGVTNYVTFSIVMRVRTTLAASGSITLADGVDLRNSTA